LTRPRPASKSWVKRPADLSSRHPKPQYDSADRGFRHDVTYAKTLLFQWDNFSIWLITGGLVLAALAALALGLDIATHHIPGINWLRFSGFAAAALLSLGNALVHSRDAYTAVAPEGLELSVLVSAILVIVGWRGWSVGLRNPSHSPVSKEVQS